MAAFALRLEEHVAASQAELSGGSYRHGRYTLFRVLDPKPRGIAAAGARDRGVHRAVDDGLSMAHVHQTLASGLTRRSSVERYGGAYSVLFYGRGGTKGTATARSTDYNA